MWAGLLLRTALRRLLSYFEFPEYLAERQQDRAHGQGQEIGFNPISSIIRIRD